MSNLRSSKPQHYGWVPPEERTDEMRAADAMALAQLPVFEIVGSYAGNLDQAFLFDARRKVTGMEDPPYFHQSTGSCVGTGGGNGLLTLRDVEIAIKGEAEEPKDIFWPMTYGESREKGGLLGRGEGSFGSAWAWAVTNYGMLAAGASPELPKYKDRNGWHYLDRETEFKWSDGRAIDPKWHRLSQEHLVGSMAKITNAEDAAAALQNGYPMTCASMFGTRGPRLKGDPQVLLAEWDGRWAHQMMVDGWWDHPSLGEIFRIGNSWGPNAHGKCPVAPAGGFWVKKSVMDRICKSEVFAMSAFDGFPARDLWFDIV